MTAPQGVLQQAIDALAEAGGNKAKAHTALGWPRTTFRERLNAAKAAGLTPHTVSPTTAPAEVLEMVETLRVENDRLNTALKEAEAAKDRRPHFTIRQDRFAWASKIRVCAVGDLHDSPKIEDKSRFGWIGAYVEETKPDAVNLIGDALTMDSLNSHIPNENYNGRAKPTFLADIASANEAFGAMRSRMTFKPELHMTDGNHERRLYLFEDRAPEAFGMMQLEYDRLLDRHGFTHSPYGQIQFYGGVGFVHAALNTLGKTYGGKNSLPTIANDSICDLVVGHSHRARVHSAPKIGQRYPTTILDLGCALPNGHIEDYAEHALNGWTYGIYDLQIQHGHIQSAKFISMAELEERYGS